MKVKELLSDESKWIKGHLAITKEGIPINPDDPMAVSWDLSGSIFKCYDASDRVFETRDLVQAELRAVVEPGDLRAFVGPWNDDPKRTFNEVKALVEKLDL